MEKKCLKASNLKSISDLGLSKRLYNLVKDYEPEELVFLVRNKDRIEGIGKAPFAFLNGIKGVGTKLFAELESVMDRAGYIRHDFDKRSLGIEALCHVLDIDYSIGDIATRAPLRTRMGVYTSNSVYEEYQNLSERQISDVIKLIDDQLSPEMAKIIKYQFNLGEAPKNISNEERARLYHKATRSLRFPSRSFSSNLKYIVCLGTEEDCNTILHEIVGELAKIYNHPVLQQERALKKNLLEVSQHASFKGAQLLEEFMDKHFSTPIETIALDLNWMCNSEIINLRRAGIYTAGDFVMFCFNNPKDWFGKAGGSRTLQEIRSIIDKFEKRGVILPLAEKLREEKLSVKLEESGLKAETLAALKRLYYYRYPECIGDVIVDLYYKPEKWFKYNYNHKPDIGYKEALELLNVIIALGFEIPPTDDIVIPEEKRELPPEFSDLKLREETKYSLEKGHINSMVQLLVAISNCPDDWYERLHLREGAVEILVKMAAMGFLDVFLPENPNKDTPGHRKHSMGEYQELFNAAN